MVFCESSTNLLVVLCEFKLHAILHQSADKPEGVDHPALRFWGSISHYSVALWENTLCYFPKFKGSYENAVLIPAFPAASEK